MGLATKPSGCVIVVIFEPYTLKLGPFLWFGNAPGRQLPDLSCYRVAKHTKGNAEGIKLDRPQIRVIPKSAFEIVETIPALTLKLFGGGVTLAMKSSPSIDVPRQVADLD